MDICSTGILPRAGGAKEYFPRGCDIPLDELKATRKGHALHLCLKSEVIMQSWVDACHSLRRVPLLEGHLEHVPVDWTGSKSMKSRA
jgi:hypothetical protein